MYPTYQNNTVDLEYFRLVNKILKEGRKSKNRTGIDTISIFGEQSKINVSYDSFPILTTKKIYFKAIVHELLWFISGSTNIKYLIDNNVHIWDEWGCKRWMTQTEIKKPISDMLPIYVDKIKNDLEFSKKYGDLGTGTYGSMWRNFPSNSNDEEYNLTNIDQLKVIINKLKTDPTDRRLIVSSWHPYWIEQCELPPCHCLFQFNSEELNNEERSYIADKRSFDKINVPKYRLHLSLYQRSGDLGLGIPFNWSSYSLLLCMVCQCLNMEPGNFVHCYGNLHIYEPHIDGLKSQLVKTPIKLPHLSLTPNIKDLFSFKYDDIKLIDYQSHPKIKFEVAV